MAAKSMAPLLLIGGAAVLILLSGKKKDDGQQGSVIGQAASTTRPGLPGRAPKTAPPGRVGA